jgi:hypothetical protein
MNGNLPDHDLVRCDGHHKMVDLQAWPTFQTYPVLGATDLTAA